MTWLKHFSTAEAPLWAAALAVASVLSYASAAGTARAQWERGTHALLDAGKSIDGPLSGGDIARYLVRVDDDSAASVIVAHQSIDVVVRVYEDDTEPAIEVASDGPDGELRLRMLAIRSGLRAVEVAAAYPKGDRGRYTIRLDAVHAATAADRDLWDAERSYSQAAHFRATDRYAAALTHAERALALRQKILGPHAPEIARSLLLLGQLHDDLARFDKAETLYARARGITAHAGDRQDSLTAQILERQAANHIVRGRYREAQPLVEHALALRERALGSRHYLVATSLGVLADLHHENANFREASAVADRAFQVAAASVDAADLRLGDFINRVARAELASGNFARAEQLYRESLAVREKAGAESFASAGSLVGLGRVALQANDNVKAEQLLVRTLAIKERIFGPNHPQVANDVFNLGLIHYRRRDYGNAVAHYHRSLAIYEKTFGATHPLIASLLNNLGLVSWRQRDSQQAEEYFGRALRQSEELFGVDSLRVASSLANLGIIAKETGNYTLAEARYRRALAIREKHLGPTHPELIVPIESLAILYRDSGDHAQAEQLFQRTLRISEAAFGPDHPFVARHLDNIAHLNWADGHWDRAFAAWKRLLAIEERNVPLNIATGSERQKLAFFEPQLRNLEEMISFHVQQPTGHAGVRDLAVTTILQRKGRVLDALADSLTAFRSRATPEDKVLLGELTQVTSRLAAAFLGDATSGAEAGRRKLADQRERLEIEINRRSAGYVAPAIPVTLAAVQDAIPPHAALVEFATYRPFDPRSPVESGKQFGPPRYIAYVVRNSGAPAWRDLGPAEEIDGIVDRFRSALADPTRPGMSSVSRQLQQRLLDPLVPLWGDATHLLISPDGLLNLIPFEALRGSAGRYLVEDVAISYITTGRDLVRMRTPRPATKGLVVFADPFFGEPAEPANSRAASTPAFAPARRSITAADDLASMYFAPLAGTAGEAQRIRRLFPDVELRVGTRATEAALKTLAAPRILHIATHGFFLQDSGSRQAKPSNAAGTRALSVSARIENPLLRSGLALAGANLTRSDSDDGLLTALEAANLNLWGTKLVTLSACDTGVGVVRNGEGVYGLRRAFFLAGAESIVMSLWPVSDLITREMMTGYYAGLKQGSGRSAALRRVQLQMLKRKDRSHPFYWASFIQAGDWASLDRPR